jgi:hypothetical protein
MRQDILCQAKSGMGKTAVFVISILQNLEPKKGVVQALVLCHTRELSFQVGTRSLQQLPVVTWCLRAQVACFTWVCTTPTYADTSCQALECIQCSIQCRCLC